MGFVFRQVFRDNRVRLPARDDIRPHHAATGVFPMTDTNDWCGEYRATELDYGPDGH